MSAKVYCLVGLVLCAALSVADWSLTWALIHGSNGEVYESNPVAAWCLKWYGWPGLALFKTVCTGTFAGAVCLLIQRQPRAGVRVVTLAILTLVLVNAYSIGLLTQLHHATRSFRVAHVPAAKMTFQIIPPIQP